MSGAGPQALEQQRKLLDKLMGPNRNGDQSSGVDFRDESVCKYFLAGFCPYELFQNTKRSLGACKQSHDYSAKVAFQNALGTDDITELDRDTGYREEFINFAHSLVRGVEDLISTERRALAQEVALKRSNVAASCAEQAAKPLLSDGEKEKIEVINESITMYVKKMDVLLEQGDLDEAERLTKSIESLKAQKEQIVQAAQRERAQKEQEAAEAVAKEQEQEVCKVCGAILVVNDTEERQKAHNHGRQHQGFLKLRESLAKWKKAHPEFVFRESFFDPYRRRRRKAQRRATAFFREQPSNYHPYNNPSQPMRHSPSQGMRQRHPSQAMRQRYPSPGMHHSSSQGMHQRHPSPGMHHSSPGMRHSSPGMRQRHPSQGMHHSSSQGMHQRHYHAPPQGMHQRHPPPPPQGMHQRPPPQGMHQSNPPPQGMHRRNYRAPPPRY